MDDVAPRPSSHAAAAAAAPPLNPGTRAHKPCAWVGAHAAQAALREAEPTLRKLFGWYSYLEDPSHLPWLRLVGLKAAVDARCLCECLCNFQVTDHAARAARLARPRGRTPCPPHPARCSPSRRHAQVIPRLSTRASATQAYAHCPAPHGRHGVFDGGQSFGRFLVTLSLVAVQVRAGEECSIGEEEPTAYATRSTTVEVQWWCGGRQGHALAWWWLCRCGRGRRTTVEVQEGTSGT